MYVNGEQKILTKKMSINEFLVQENYDIRKIAVGKNGTIIPKKSFDSEMLCDNDDIDIVSLVGGG